MGVLRIKSDSVLCWLVKKHTTEPNPEVRRHYTDVIAQRELRRRSAPVQHACLWWRLNDRATAKLLEVKSLGAKEGLHCSRTKKQGEQGFLFYTDAY